MCCWGRRCTFNYGQRILGGREGSCLFGAVCGGLVFTSRYCLLFTIRLFAYRTCKCAQFTSKLRKLVMDREAWCAAVHGVTKRWTRLNWNKLKRAPERVITCSPNKEIQCSVSSNPFMLRIHFTLVFSRQCSQLPDEPALSQPCSISGCLAPATGILVPQSGMEPWSRSMESQPPDHQGKSQSHSEHYLASSWANKM